MSLLSCLPPVYTHIQYLHSSLFFKQTPLHSADVPLSLHSGEILENYFCVTAGLLFKLSFKIQIVVTSKEKMLVFLRLDCISFKVYWRMEGYDVASVKFRNAPSLSTLDCALLLLNQIYPLLYPYCLLIECTPISRLSFPPGAVASPWTWCYLVVAG